MQYIIIISLLYTHKKSPLYFSFRWRLIKSSTKFVFFQLWAKYHPFGTQLFSGVLKKSTNIRSIVGNSEQVHVQHPRHRTFHLLPRAIVIAYTRVWEKSRKLKIKVNAGKFLKNLENPRKFKNLHWKFFRKNNYEKPTVNRNIASHSVAPWRRRQVLRQN